MPRDAGGQMNGKQCLSGLLDLYDVAGAIRLQLLGLIKAEHARQGDK